MYVWVSESIRAPRENDLLQEPNIRTERCWEGKPTSHNESASDSANHNMIFEWMIDSLNGMEWTDQEWIMDQ